MMSTILPCPNRVSKSQLAVVPRAKIERRSLRTSADFASLFRAAAGEEESVLSEDLVAEVTCVRDAGEAGWPDEHAEADSGVIGVKAMLAIRLMANWTATGHGICLRASR